MKRRSQLIILGIAVLLASCSDTTKQDQANAPEASQTPNPASSTQPAAAGFANPTIKPTATVQVAAVPGLLQPTNARLRAPSISTGRSDPFAELMTGPIRVATARNTSLPVRRPQTTRSLTPLNLSPLASLPKPPKPVPVATLPNASPSYTPLPALPAVPSSTTLPPINVPIAPPSPTSLADAIEITGAIQVKNQWHVIVKEPNAGTSRYVTTGDLLANGQVLVKQVIASAGADPIVILQQNGKQITKTVGMSGGPIASAQ